MKPEAKSKSKVRGHIAAASAQRSLFDAIPDPLIVSTLIVSTLIVTPPAKQAGIKAARSRNGMSAGAENGDEARSTASFADSRVATGKVATGKVATGKVATGKTVAPRSLRSAVRPNVTPTPTSDSDATRATPKARPPRAAKTRVAPSEGAKISKAVSALANAQHDTAPKPVLSPSRGAGVKTARVEVGQSARKKILAVPSLSSDKTAREKKSKSEIEATATSEAKAPRAKRKRVPRDLAQQYGESESRRAAAAVVEMPTTRRARRDAEMRERRNRVMLPDENFLQRLARSGAISSLSPPLQEANAATNLAAASVGNADSDAEASSPKKTRGWSADCGKCRWNGTLKCAAALCPRCGAILVRP